MFDESALSSDKNLISHIIGNYNQETMNYKYGNAKLLLAWISSLIARIYTLVGRLQYKMLPQAGLIFSAWRDATRATHPTPKR